MWRVWQPRCVCVAFVVLPIGLSRPADWRPRLPAGVMAASARPAQVQPFCQPGVAMARGCIANISGSGTPPLKEPEGIAVSAAGDVFVADTGNSLVREIKPGTRTLTTVAGGGSDDAASGGSPTDAALENPAGVAVDAQGNLFIADTGDHRVLEVSADLHSITTVAGDSGDGNATDREPSGPALGAAMDPKGIAVDAAGNVYVVDGTEVREINTASPRTITTVAGNNRDDASGVGCAPEQCASVRAIQAKLSGPSGLALDTAGNLYIADYNNLRVRKVDAAPPHVMSVAAGSGNGGYGGDCGQATANAVGLYEPRDVAVDGKGNLYITADDVLRMVDPTGRIVTVAGTADTEARYPCDLHDAATSFDFDNLWGIAVDGAGNLYLTDNNANQVLEVAAPAVAGAATATSTPAGTPTVIRIPDITPQAHGSPSPHVPSMPAGEIMTIAGDGTAGWFGDGGSARRAMLDGPRSLAVDKAGDVFIADTGNNVIREVHSSWPMTMAKITTVAGDGTAGFAGDGHKAMAAELSAPQGVAVDAAGDLFIADTGNGRVREVRAATGIITTIAGPGKSIALRDGGPAIDAAINPVSVAVDAGGDVFIADSAHQRVRKVDGTTGIISTVAGNGARNTDGLYDPSGLAADARGNVYVADTGNMRVREISAVGGVIGVAGSGHSGYSGDGRQATQASLFLATSVAVDQQSDLYIADGNNVVRMVERSSRAIFTVAGTGQVGYSGDAGPATKAEFDCVQGIAVDGEGDLYIADAQANVVREVFAPADALKQSSASTPPATATPTTQPTPDLGRSRLQGTPARPRAGQILTVAGAGRAGHSGDGGPATRAWLNHPQGVAVDRAGNLYIADTNNQQVRRVDAATGIITTFAGTGTRGDGGDGGPATKALLASPEGLALDSAGNLYIVDSGNQRIREVHTGSGIISTVSASNNPGRLAQGVAAPVAPLLAPHALAIDREDNLYIAYGTSDQGVVLLKLSLSRHVITAVLGIDEVSRPEGLAVDSAGHLYAAADRNGFVSGPHGRVGTGPTTYGCVGDGDQAQSAGLIRPTGLALDRAGNLYIVDSGCATVREVFAASGIIMSVAGTGYAAYRGGYDAKHGGFQAATIGGFSGDGGPAIQAELSQPSAIALDAAGNLYIADSGNDMIREVGAPPQAVSATVLTAAGTGKAGAFSWQVPAVQAGLDEPRSLAVDSHGNVFIADTLFNRVMELHASTGLLTQEVGSSTLPGYAGDGGPAAAARLNAPEGLALSGDELLYIADTGNNAIREVDLGSGIISTVAGDGQAGFDGDGGPPTAAMLDGPCGVAVDSHRNLFIADTGNNRIREVILAAHRISTVAGNGMAGYSGDGGTAAQARLRGPEDVAIRPDGSYAGWGDMYIADTGNNVIRRVSRQGTPAISTLAGNGEQGYAGDGGEAGQAELNQPRGVALDYMGNIVVADAGNDAVREVIRQVGGPLLSSTDPIRTLAGTGVTGLAGGSGPATRAELDQPYGVATYAVYRGARLPRGVNVYVADTGNNMVREIVAGQG